MVSVGCAGASISLVGKQQCAHLTRECRSAHVYEWWCALDTLGQVGRCCTLKDQVPEK